MPNITTTDQIKNILRGHGYIKASEIEALGRTKPGQVIYQLRKKGMEIRTVKTPTDVEYHLEEGGVKQEPELTPAPTPEPPKEDKRWDKLKAVINMQVDFMSEVGNMESTGGKTLKWLQKVMKSIEKEENK